MSDLIEQKTAPVQGFIAGIPWEMHLRAYDAYCLEFREQPALIDLEGKNCRGGFGTSELDRYIPNWRDELSTLAAKDKRIAELEATNMALRAANLVLKMDQALAQED